MENILQIVKDNMEVVSVEETLLLKAQLLHDIENFYIEPEEVVSAPSATPAPLIDEELQRVLSELTKF